MKDVKKKISYGFIVHRVEIWNWLLNKNSQYHEKPPSFFKRLFVFPFNATASLYYLLNNKAYENICKFDFNGKLKGNILILRNFAWHFFIKEMTKSKFLGEYFRSKIRRRIERTILEAQDNGIKVIGLGALTKDQTFSQGGKYFVNKLGDKLKVPIVHGDTLTAAAVYKQALQLMRTYIINKDKPIFLTGATSKIGRAIALMFAIKGYQVYMYTSSEERFKAIQEEANMFGKNLHHVTSLEKGKDCEMWITGKFKPSGKSLINYIPDNSIVLNFSVPNPLDKNDKKLILKGVQCYEGGLLEYDPVIAPEFEFTMRLRKGLTYACHAGTMVHAYNGWTHHEVDQVDIFSCKEAWRAAEEIGFRLPKA